MNNKELAEKAAWKAQVIALVANKILDESEKSTVSPNQQESAIKTVRKLTKLATEHKEEAEFYYSLS